MVSFIWKICISFLFFAIIFRYVNSQPSLNISNSRPDPLYTFATEMSFLELSYGQNWKPPKQDFDWNMDCSNTIRYTYLEVFQKNLPRSSLDQYLFAKKQNFFHPISLDSNKDLTITYLKSKLEPGDILFWENTYNVQKVPPISHAMIYLGTDSSDKMLIFGASTSGKSQVSSKAGGIGIYRFDPYQHIGCVKDSLGICTHPSRFVGWAHFPQH